MSYQIEFGESVQAGLQRIAIEQIDKAIDEIDATSMNVHDKVHQVRKRCKKLRGLLRLARPALEGTYQRENKCIRNAARVLSDIRDAKSIVNTYDAVTNRFADQINRSAFGSIRAQLTRQLHGITRDEVESALSWVGNELESVKARVGDWELDDDGFESIAAGVTKTRERAIERFSDVRGDPGADLLHQWRKRVKYHWYHLRLLRGVWPQLMDALIEAADQLGDLLGDDHDLAVFAETLQSEEEHFGSSSDVAAMTGLIGQRRKELQSEAMFLGQRLFAESSRCFCERLGAYWQTR